jgi:hypothetical protein
MTRLLNTPFATRRLTLVSHACAHAGAQNVIKDAQAVARARADWVTALAVRPDR